MTSSFQFKNLLCESYTTFLFLLNFQKIHFKIFEKNLSLIAFSELNLQLVFGIKINFKKLRKIATLPLYQYNIFLEKIMILRLNFHSYHLNKSLTTVTYRIEISHRKLEKRLRQLNDALFLKQVFLVKQKYSLHKLLQNPFPGH